MKKAMNPLPLRRQLLTTASALALVAAIYGEAEAANSDAGRPTVWIDVGWQFERFSVPGELFAPPFLTATPRPDFETVSPFSVQQMKPFSYGAEGGISFQPEDSDWVFSASVRIGRSHGRRNIHQQTAVTKVPNPNGPGKYSIRRVHEYDLASGHIGETHVFVDFQAGKDVGLGALGAHGSSTISAGIRFAQFNTASGTNIRERPQYGFSPVYLGFLHRNYFFATYHRFAGAERAARNFRGLGPSISWNGSAAISGNSDAGEIDLDWGANAAVLFGRQRTKTAHNTTGGFWHSKYGTSVLYQNQKNNIRKRSLVVPNAGGFAGISFRYVDAKISLGYRGDFFFGAIDGGIDARKSTTRGFYGPFASVSIGMGD